jgi:hypothetical protein
VAQDTESSLLNTETKESGMGFLFSLFNTFWISLSNVGFFPLPVSPHPLCQNALPYSFTTI